MYNVRLLFNKKSIMLLDSNEFREMRRFIPK